FQALPRLRIAARLFRPLAAVYLGLPGPEICAGLRGAGQLGRVRLRGRLHLFLLCHTYDLPCLDLPSVLETDALPIELLPSGSPPPDALVCRARTRAH